MDYSRYPVLIAGITTAINSYNGSFLVDEVTSNTQFTVQTPNVPANALPTPQEIQNSSVIVESDTVGSASPYIFNVSLRSVFGMNGLDCDGEVRQLVSNLWFVPSLLVSLFRKMITCLYPL